MLVIRIVLTNNILSARCLKCHLLLVKVVKIKKKAEKEKH